MRRFLPTLEEPSAPRPSPHSASACSSASSSRLQYAARTWHTWFYRSPPSSSSWFCFSSLAMMHLRQGVPADGCGMHHRLMTQAGEPRRSDRPRCSAPRRERLDSTSPGVESSFEVDMQWYSHLIALSR